jgi:hypothetical protein
MATNAAISGQWPQRGVSILEKIVERGCVDMSMFVRSTPLDETEDKQSWLVHCPHCFGGVEVLKINVNCAIFRHAIYKPSGEQVDPHLPKEQCDALVAGDRVDGCCKPFKIDVQQRVAVACDYI